ncbi:hypothetical protein ACERK3_19240 [Phycisphaerales bacterium AB-hyl4]|uniref:Uncharacterized protein n=1 Tax=Natronomicrosphaera hydrolytica TaxID=3242702 RepID=A0ABV4U9Y5_9BACT
MNVKLAEKQQIVEWMGVRLLLPASWQVVRHSLGLAKGSLALVDRRRQRLQVIWSDWPTKPDVNHLIADYRSQQTDRDSNAVFESLDLPEPWQGVGRHVDKGGMLVRAARFDPLTYRLIETAMLVDREDPAERLLVSEVLGNLEVVCRPEDAQQWQAFDVNLTTPSGYRLRQATVKPMNVSLRFMGYDVERDRYDRRESRVRRMAMAQAWYKGAERMLQTADLNLVFDHRPMQLGRHAATLSTSDEVGTRWERLTGKLRRRRDLVWHCDREDAVYQVTTFSPQRADVDPEDFTVSCCREITP